MTISSEWIKKDFKQKYFLYCKDCIAQIPQKTIKTEENRVKTIIITEIPCTVIK
jgi:translation initiation factor 2 beta subunit (eIF-2beta)/eIF-5